MDSDIPGNVSYSKLEERDTAFCLQRLAATMNQQVILPAAIKHHYLQIYHGQYRPH